VGALDFRAVQMSTRLSIIVEREESGVFDAYVEGLPVYAQGSTRGAAVRATCDVLHPFLDANPTAEPNTPHNRFTAKAARQRIRRSHRLETHESDSLFRRAVDGSPRDQSAGSWRTTNAGRVTAPIRCAGEYKGAPHPQMNGHSLRHFPPHFAGLSELALVKDSSAGEIVPHKSLASLMNSHI
jgi:hypothetical protein